MTMPLFAYFTRVGLALLALLLVLNSMLEPKNPEPDLADAAIETFVRARSTTGAAHPSEADRSHFEPQRSEAANFRAPEQTQQVSTEQAEPAPLPEMQPKSKSAQAKVRKIRKRRIEPSAYSSYARGSFSFSAAENRHAPW